MKIIDPSELHRPEPKYNDFNAARRMDRERDAYRQFDVSISLDSSFLFKLPNFAIFAYLLGWVIATVFNEEIHSNLAF